VEFVTRTKHALLDTNFIESLLNMMNLQGFFPNAKADRVARNPGKAIKTIKPEKEK
jgi:hypothetical protein